MTSIEEKLMLREAMYHFIESARIEAESLSSKCFTLNPKSMEFVESSSKFGGYFSIKTWLYNNSDCESISDLEKRIQAFEDIINHPKNQLAETFMEGACFAEADPFDQEKCLKAFQKCGVTLSVTSPFHIRDMGDTIFQQGLKIIEDLLSDPDVQRKEDECHFQLYGGHLQHDWTGVGFYQVICSNHECLKQLKQFRDSVIKESSESVLQK